MKAALFVCVAVVQQRYDRVDVRALHGRARELPVIAAVYGLAALAIAGAPPFGSFLGRALIEDAALELPGYAWVPAALALVCALSAGALLRAGARVFGGWGARAPHDPMGESPDAGEEETADESGEVPRATSPWLWAPGVVLVAGALAWGLVPGLAQAAADAAASFCDPVGYAHAVLGGRAVPAPRDPARPRPGSHGVPLRGGLDRRGAPRGGARTARERAPAPGQAIADRIRALHSGHPGDYVAWAAAGATVLTALFALTLS